jgi:hypothetical protein
MRYRNFGRKPWCLFVAAAIALPGCKLPGTLSPFTIGSKAPAVKSPTKVSEARASEATAQQVVTYPGVQTSYQTPARATSAQACGFG